MKRQFLAIFIATALAFPTATLAESWKRIKSEEQFRTVAVDRKSVNKNGWVTAKSNGTMTGSIKGQGKIRGKWAWGNGFMCRNINVGKKALGQNCQTVHISGDKIRFTRDQGKGQQSVWVLQ